MDCLRRNRCRSFGVMYAPLYEVKRGSEEMIKNQTKTRKGGSEKKK
ncbi:MAG: hypothetical protein BSOLF_1073 [Candidatus Carbobacillus altaicus]|uniref:Uncharacterized protein n=1 Tax=Candidatus Carbonibacillus altaicus TaxID=2163959 RepID=A0A2R6XX95_9BACL|nr:MAG: hypothetical protein BSOLF_1073 [Candidatus Carbobacillus altaicus]